MSKLVQDVTSAAMRQLRGLFASGVTVITTRHADGLRGITVSAFSALSLEPPLVLICLANEAEAREVITASGVFGVNILSDDQEFLSERFAARAPLVNAQFEGVPYFTAVTGAPLLPESVAWYDCRVETQIDGGDHTIIVGRVAALGQGDAHRRPLLYYAGSYARLHEA